MELCCSHAGDQKRCHWKKNSRLVSFCFFGSRRPDALWMFVFFGLLSPRFLAVLLYATVGPFTVLKFKDQNFISNIYYRKGPSFTTVSRCVRSLAGQPNFTAHFQRAPLLLQQYQGEGNTGVVMFQKSSNIFSSCFILSWKRLL